MKNTITVESPHALSFGLKTLNEKFSDIHSSKHKVGIQAFFTEDSGLKSLTEFIKPYHLNHGDVVVWGSDTRTVGKKDIKLTGFVSPCIFGEWFFNDRTVQRVLFRRFRRSNQYLAYIAARPELAHLEFVWSSY